MGLFSKLFGFPNRKPSGKQVILFRWFFQQTDKRIQAKAALFSGPAQYCRGDLQGFQGI
ncbi:MAG: hypothetical protein ACRESZ_03520 [Methylococcales bacterium]